MGFNHGIHRIHGMIISLVLLFGVAVSAVAAEPEITVEARQRYPWNGLVDLHFTITGDAGTKYDTSFTAKDMVGGTNVAMKTIRKSNGVAAEEKEKFLPGTYNLVWDAAADLPKDFKCDRMTVTGTADISAFPYTVKFNANGGTGTMANESFTYGTAKALTANAFTRTGYTFQGWATSANGAKVYNDKQSVSNLTETDGAVVNLYAVWKGYSYMVINVSYTGDAPSKYAVQYANTIPTGKWGDWDANKTARFVLRRIEPGTFKMGGQYDVTLTKAFYIGIYEVSIKQYGFVAGKYPSDASSWSLPVSHVTWDDIRGSSSTYNWPSSSAVNSKSFMGILRAKTGLNFDLPTEAQWEYACRAGTTSKYNNGGDTENDLKTVGRYSGNSGGDYGTLGSYQANNWGLYDMHGNVSEWCLDWYGSISGGSNPVGASSGQKRVLRGGCWHDGASSCTSVYRGSASPSTTDYYYYYGFRICLTVSN